MAVSLKYGYLMHFFKKNLKCQNALYVIFLLTLFS